MAVAEGTNPMHTARRPTRRAALPYDATEWERRLAEARVKREEALTRKRAHRDPGPADGCALADAVATPERPDAAPVQDDSPLEAPGAVAWPDPPARAARAWLRPAVIALVVGIGAGSFLDNLGDLARGLFGGEDPALAQDGAPAPATEPVALASADAAISAAGAPAGPGAAAAGPPDPAQVAARAPRPGVVVAGPQEAAAAPGDATRGMPAKAGLPPPSAPSEPGQVLAAASSGPPGSKSPLTAPGAPGNAVMPASFEPLAAPGAGRPGIDAPPLGLGSADADPSLGTDEGPAAQPDAADAGSEIIALSAVAGGEGDLAAEDAPPALASRVYIYVPKSVPQDVRQTTVGVLRERNWPAEEPRTSPFTIRDTHVRYYHADDREGAEELAALVGGDARDFTSYTPKPETGFLELWLAGDAPARARGGVRKPGVPDPGRAIVSFLDQLAAKVNGKVNGTR